MNLTVIALIILALIALRFTKASMLTWLAAWLVSSYLLLSYGFEVPIPASVIKIYMGIVCLSMLAYILTDTERIQEVWQPFVAFTTERRYQPMLALVALAIPALIAFRIYAGMTAPAQAPLFARTVHPAPPDQVSVHEKDFALGTMDNPYRELEESDPAAFAERVEAGRVVYYANCFWCHGDLMAGAGMFAHGLNPIPTNFQDPGTIAMLREAFLFWRIAKGAPGLPEEGGPWDSAMPAWESFLSEEEIWNVILFLYEFTEHRPRAVELH